MPMAAERREALLVDSSIYIDLLRKGEDVGTRLRDLVDAGTLLTCGIVRIEVLRGIVDRRIRQWMASLFDEMIECPLDYRLVSDAAELAWRLDRRGTVLPIPDVVIAACALRAGAAVATTDPHFRLVPGLKVTATLAAR
jgi:predicted nucleic acid-binding protein